MAEAVHASHGTDTAGAAAAPPPLASGDDACDGTAGKGKLVGILTNRDVRFATRLDQPVSELMTKDKLVTVKRSVSQDEAKKLRILQNAGSFYTISDRLQGIRDQKRQNDFDEKGIMQVH